MTEPPNGKTQGAYPVSKFRYARNKCKHVLSNILLDKFIYTENYTGPIRALQITIYITKYTHNTKINFQTLFSLKRSYFPTKINFIPNWCFRLFSWPAFDGPKNLVYYIHKHLPFLRVRFSALLRNILVRQHEVNQSKTVLQGKTLKRFQNV